MEILFKCLLASSIVLLFDYKPSFLVMPVIVLMLLLMCWMGVFFAYEKISFWLYAFMGLITCMAYATYFLDFFWVLTCVMVFAVAGFTLGAHIFVLFNHSKMKKDNLNDIFFEDDE